MFNRGLLTALTAIGAAQLLKLPVKYLTTGQWDMKKIAGTGGMPSSHSSGVTALAVFTGRKYGMSSPEFAIASMLGLVVMYDAMNIRRHAGEIAIQVNDLDLDVEKLTGHHPDIDHKRRKEKLKETLGHHPKEVFVGALLGALIGVLGAEASKR
ncbi:divergent PAP2 family protein [Paenibacillus sp. GSMTC-2017]|uniref:divergent PAP2 family protein n=1 Tax=Paenibacillus sp. GSMTC-2017 TaxID=2794350 RepID=UPI0018D6C45B|nr:divergent PAP2 family protein [Paenibacillus sp. GSMTC-2017]MBH5320172.1 divergent PAP2 family protein [Paenibacillus sp. GSMTC-2017]